MIISGWGILLIFSANQAITQTLAPYSPFGLATLTVLVVAAFLKLLGIYNSAVLVSTNNTLRKSIRKHALESRLLDIIGHAEMEKEIQKTVTKIIESQDIGELHRETGIELDGSELRRYIDVAVREVKKDDKRPSS
jgi:high-affinity nickel permease